MRPRVLRRLLIAVILVTAAFSARAQFVVDGTERTFLKWNQIKTEDYRFVFPAEIDSLARIYASEWERWKLPVSYSIGRVPNQGYFTPMPVILHPYLGYSNGMVVWTPRRMEMYTGPDMYSPDPIAWPTVLAIHEQRHVAQLQFIREGSLRKWSYLFGEAPAGLFSIYYFDPSHWEGDAVAIESALSLGGRARTADFLEYYRASFADGGFRNYERWRYGSQRLYTPDYYKVGYLAIGGVRAVYDKPLFMKDYYDWRISYRKQLKRQTHMKFKDAFGGVLAAQDSLWRQDDSLRALAAPFQPVEPITRPGRYFTSFSGLTYSDGKLYARRSGIADDHAIVSVDPADGKARQLHSTGAKSALTSGGGRLYWSEVTYNPRWEMHSNSSIRYLENGSTHTLIREGRWLNPKVNGDTLAVCRTGHDGADYVSLLDASDGSVLAEFRAPDGMTPYEAVVNGGEIFCAAITDAGEGIYRLPSFAPVLEPSFVKINHLFVFEDKLFFTSDRTGVNELYSLEGGEVFQHTQLKAGGQDFVFGDDGFLYFCGLRSDGRMIYRTPVDSLPVRAVNFNERHRYELEERLAAQEAALAAAPDTAAPVIGETKRYSKLAHAIKIHSWLPFYADYDELAELTGQTLYHPLGLGATAFFQNNLSTLYGYIGLCGYPGSLKKYGHLIDEGVASITYRGLYPVFEGKFRANGKGMEGMASAYVPLNFSSDGWSRGIVPSIEYTYSSIDFYQTSLYSTRIGYKSEVQRVAAGIRAYSMQPTLNSCYFPNLGMGVSAGVVKDFDYKPLLPYASVYGYLPGLWKTSGLGLSLSYSTEPLNVLSVEGLTAEDIEAAELYPPFPFFVRTYACTKDGNVSHSVTDFRMNYAIPFLSVDWNGLSPVAYVRNFEFIPKFSFTHHDCIGNTSWIPNFMSSYNMWTAGAAFDVVLGNFWFIPYNIRLGVSAVYVQGNPDPEAKPYEINLILNIDL